jgi:hypothetical protein
MKITTMKAAKTMMTKATTTMTKAAQPRSAKRPAAGAPGVKMLITAGALAATMLGWAMLTAKDRVAVAPPVVASVSAPPPALALDLPPIPTVVPPVQPAPVAANPQPGIGVAQSAPPLRSVSMPVTVSQSSR